MRALAREPEQRDREAVGTVEVRLQRRLDRREVRGRAGHAEVAADARVVHEHVQPAGITAHLRCRLRDTARVGDIDAQRTHRRAGGRRHLLPGNGRLLSVAHAQRNVIAALCEPA